MESILFEKGDLMNRPVECFGFDSAIASFPVRPHFHYYMEIVLMKEGCATIHCNSRSYTLRKNEMILFHPNSVHSIYSADGESLFFYGIKLDINQLGQTSAYSPKLRSIFKSIEQKQMDIVIPKEFVISHNFEAFFKRCLDEVRSNAYGNDLVIRSQIYILLLDIIRHYMDEGFSIDKDTYAEDGRYDVFNITDYITENIGNQIKVSDIAEKCNMSYSYFVKKFHSVYQKNCKTYIEELRIYRAEELLLFSDFDVNYIAQECGFSDCSHFINSFKKYHGTTPKKYRSEHAKKG